MSQVLIIFIRAYQILVSPILHTAVGPSVGCRYEISCSEYFIISLKTKGFIRGAYLGFKRIISCI